LMGLAGTGPVRTVLAKMELAKMELAKMARA
jgi:hypothetical protein